MSKWTWPALAALLAVAAGSYYLLTQRREPAAASDSSDIDVEAFGDDVEGEDGGDNTFEMLEDTPSQGTAKPAQAGATAAEQGIKTIDDDDDMGETVKDPVVIDDDEDGSVEAAQPNPTK